MERSHQQAHLSLTKFSYAIEQLQRTLRPVLSAIDGLRSSSNEEELDALSRTRMHISLAYAVNSLFCMYLRTQGVDPATHPVAEEIARVQDAFMRMRKVEAGKSTSHKQQPKRDRRKHIANAKKSAARLAALVFPEEDDLLRALQGQPRRPELEAAENAKQKDIHDDSESSQSDHERTPHEPHVEFKTEKEQNAENTINFVESDDKPHESNAVKALEHSEDGATENLQNHAEEKQKEQTFLEKTVPILEEKHERKKKKKSKDREKGMKRKDHEEKLDMRKKEKRERSRRKDKDTDTSKTKKKRRHSESGEAPVADTRENKRRKRDKKKKEYA